MIIRLNIDSDCGKNLYYTNMGKLTKIPRYKTRLSEYEGEQLLKELQQDPNNRSIYLYTIKYPDGKMSIIANPNYPLGALVCK